MPEDVLRELDKIIYENNLLTDNAYQVGGVLEIPSPTASGDEESEVLNHLTTTIKNKMDLARRMSFIVGDRLNNFLSQRGIFFLGGLARKLGLTYICYPTRKVIIFSRTSWTKF